MKNKHFLATCALIASLATPGIASSPYENDEAITSNAFNSNFVPRQSSNKGVEHSVSRLGSSSNSLGTDMSPDAEPASKTMNDSGNWFSYPAIYTEHSWTGSNDKRPAGVDSDRYTGLIGMDFVTKGDVVVGLLYSYSHEWGEIDEIPLDLDTNYNSLTLYAGKNYMDWINLGVTFTYSNNDTKGTIAGTSGDFGWEIDSYSPSFYIGAAHSWDAWSFSSTLNYIYTAEEVERHSPGIADYDQSTGSLVWMNKVTYYVTDMFSVAGLFNITQIAHTNASTNTPPVAGESNDHNWGTLGVEFSYYPCEKWELTAGTRYDVFNENYEETVTVSVGATYSF